MSDRIAAVRTRVIPVVLSRPWGPAVPRVSVIEVTVQRSDGAEGRGFSWTPSIGATAVDALLRDDLAPWLVGRSADPAQWLDAWSYVHEAGGGGVTTIALAGVDLALWDLRLREKSISLADALGRRHDSLPVYGSGVNLHYSLEQLVAQARRWCAEGYTGVKIKVGKPDLAEDLDRVAAVRDVVGPGMHLMVDANQRWDVDTAVRAVGEISRFGIDWIEEPLRSDDTRGYRTLRRSVDVPVALGENVNTVHRFRDLVDAEAIDIMQPNIVRVGGITPFRQISELAAEADIRLAPHLLPELSAQLAFAEPQECWIEDVEDARFESLGVLSEPSGITIDGGRAVGGHAPGLGMRFA